jgi:hypothetical protein
MLTENDSNGRKITVRTPKEQQPMPANAVANVVGSPVASRAVAGGHGRVPRAVELLRRRVLPALPHRRPLAALAAGVVRRKVLPPSRWAVLRVIKAFPSSVDIRSFCIEGS